MPAARKNVCALLILGLLVVPIVSGCAGAESGPASAQAQGGIVGGLVEKLNREDDESEAKERAEHEESTEEQQEAQEQTEQERSARAEREQEELQGRP